MNQRDNTYLTPWDLGSDLYRRLLIAGVAGVGIGIVLAIVGATTKTMMISWVAIGLIGIGLICHISAQITRVRDARRRARTGNTPRR